MLMTSFVMASARVSFCCPVLPGQSLTMTCGMFVSLRPDQDLDGLAVIHGAVPIRHAVEIDRSVEDAARIDTALEDIGQQLFDVCAHRRRTSADHDVLVEERLGRGYGFIVRYAHSPDRAAGTG